MENKEWKQPLDYDKMCQGGEPEPDCDFPKPMSEKKTKEMLEWCRKTGRKWQARYIELYGTDCLIPVIGGTANKDEIEQEYKRYIELGHPWDFYNSIPDDVIL